MPASSSSINSPPSSTASAAFSGAWAKVGKVAKTAFEKRIRKLAIGHKTLENIAPAMLAARATLLRQFTKLRKAVLA